MAVTKRATAQHRRDIAALKRQGTKVSEDQVAALRKRYGLDGPVHERYVKWMGGLLRGDLGKSFLYNRPVSALIGERLALTATISICSILLTWVIAIPVGIYSATRQYSLLDYVFTFIGFVGIATPAFMLALIMMYMAHTWFDLAITGLFSPKYAAAPWSVGKFLDMLKRVGARPDHRYRGDCGHDPGAERLPARRTAQAVCRDCPSQGAP